MQKGGRDQAAVGSMRGMTRTWSLHCWRIWKERRVRRARRRRSKRRGRKGERMVMMRGLTRRSLMMTRRGGRASR